MKYLLLTLLLLVPNRTLAFDAFKATGIDQKQESAVPLDLSFNDERGQRVTLRGLSAGKPIVLIPVLHKCPNICGVTLSGVMGAIADQSYRPKRDFALVAFGIDPKETFADAEGSLVELRKRFPKLAGEAHALTGDAKAIRAVTDALGYRYAWDPDISQYAHVAATSVLTANGHLSRWLYGLAPTAEDMRLALTEAGKGQIGSWTDQILLLCYHYDLVTGRYSSSIQLALRLSGAATIVLIAAFVGSLFWGEKRRAKGAGHA